jgi:hypothetical protein
MNKKIRSISLSKNMDNQLKEDSEDRGLTISANVSRILYDYFQDSNHKTPKKVLLSSTHMKSD